MKLSENSSSRTNNFDALRLVGAMLVLVSHAFALAGRAEPTIGGLSFGAIGVYLFFAISGFLITQSWDRQPSLARFTAKRVLRILPALVAVSILTAYVLGPLASTSPLTNYFGSAAVHGYVVRNSTLRIDYLLPGVFNHNAYPYVVNGSLWTLPVEARCYAAVAIVGVVLLGVSKQRTPSYSARASRRHAGIAAGVVVLIGSSWLLLHALSDSHAIQSLGLAPPSRFELLGDPHQEEPLVLVFAVGALMYLARDSVSLRWEALVILLALWLSANHWHVMPANLRTNVLPALVFPYSVLVIAFRGSRVLGRATTRGDISYGVYLWAFPVGQAVASIWGNSATPATIIGVSLVPTFLLGALSWVAVERPALLLKPRPTHVIPQAGALEKATATHT